MLLFKAQSYKLSLLSIFEVNVKSTSRSELKSWILTGQVFSRHTLDVCKGVSLPIRVSLNTNFLTQSGRLGTFWFGFGAEESRNLHNLNKGLSVFPVFKEYSIFSWRIGQST